MDAGTDPRADGGPAQTLGDEDEARRSALRRMKAVATGLLAVAAAGYGLTLHQVGWLGFVNAACEAAMIGAAADWFAVTALFRHPLGLPIPHTALIPTRKDALARSLQDFVATHFLAPDVVRSRVAAVGVARRAGTWLADPPHAERVAAELAGAGRGLLQVLHDDRVAALLEEIVLRPMLARPWAPPAGRLLEHIVTERAHHRLVDLIAEELHVWLERHEDVVTALVRDRAPAWTPSWLDERVAQRAYHEALRWAADVRNDPRHRVRLAVDDMLVGLAKDLQSDPVMQARAMDLQQRIMANPGVREAVEALWTAVRRVLEEAIRNQDSDLRRRLVAGIASFGRRLSADPELQASVDGYVEDAAGHLVTSYRDEVATVISETVQRWDGREASRRIELYVGRDLQFIRINGTIVGGLVGVLIHAVTVLVG
ncbi:MAG TPA: DUF445 domain-containing protein [Kineosporiaceae bacterium]|nr:DUF445 domain-containing protein [Kineosporiaceae bacterium]